MKFGKLTAISSFVFMCTFAAPVLADEAQSIKKANPEPALYFAALDESVLAEMRGGMNKGDLINKIHEWTAAMKKGDRPRKIAEEIVEFVHDSFISFGDGIRGGRPPADP